MAKVVVVGSLTVDFTAFSKRLPYKGETVLGYDFTIIAGGKGNNQAVAACRLGADVSMIGCVGNDSLKETVYTGLREAGIALDGITEVAMPTGVAHIEVDSDGDNRIVMIPLANNGLTKEVVRLHSDTLREASVLLCQLEIPLEAVVEAFRIGKESNAVCILNPAPAQDIPDELLALCDVLVPNETELAVLSGGSLLPDALDRKDVIDWAVETVVQWLGSSEVFTGTVVVTLGKWGSIAIDPKNSAVVEVPPMSVVAVDSTAAGDAFCGGLVAELARGKDLIASLSVARVAGALAVTKPGALSSLPTREEVNSFVAASNDANGDDTLTW